MASKALRRNRIIVPLLRLLPLLPSRRLRRRFCVWRARGRARAVLTCGARYRLLTEYGRRIVTQNPNCGQSYH